MLRAPSLALLNCIFVLRPDENEMRASRKLGWLANVSHWSRLDVLSEIEKVRLIFRIDGVQNLFRRDQRLELTCYWTNLFPALQKWNDRDRVNQHSAGDDNDRPGDRFPQSL